VIYQAET